MASECESPSIEIGWKSFGSVYMTSGNSDLYKHRILGLRSSI
ncbi:hypothetical protein [Bacillus chungangensis]|uniref:Uncharacterized protein n=1 Tax=Bacillus chungangensis TaxID=587633 RepID=A0ABT9WLZ6_9BACI|nr:hypothetical protein [Bacillus chungangensis]MDQ0174200.1 hypothetical protein [Bacillus chungangensis]